MKRLLIAGLALSAALTACKKSEEESDAAPVEETTPSVPAPAPAPVNPDTTMRIDSMRDTTTTTHM